MVKLEHEIKQIGFKLVTTGRFGASARPFCICSCGKAETGLSFEELGLKYDMHLSEENAWPDEN